MSYNQDNDKHKYNNLIDFYMNVLSDARVQTTQSGKLMTNVIASISSKPKNGDWVNLAFKVIFMEDEYALSIVKGDRLRLKGSLNLEAPYTNNRTGEVSTLHTIFCKEWDKDSSDRPARSEYNNKTNNSLTKPATTQDEGYSDEVPF